jgi:protein-S-isoprenylcysteine O-methyltransferase Ste14
VTLTLAVGLSSLSVAMEGAYGLLSRTFGRPAWLAHAALSVPPWVWFLRSLRHIPRTRRRVSPALGWAGLAGEAAGLALVAAGFLRLGPAAVVNGDLFGLIDRNRPYRPVFGVVKDPIYTGYAAWLAGWGLRTGRISLLPLAVQMFVMLTLEARIEDWAAGRRPTIAW